MILAVIASLILMIAALTGVTGVMNDAKKIEIVHVDVAAEGDQSNLGLISALLNGTDSVKSICSFSDASFSDTQNAIHDVQKAVILHFAKEGPCVILGRCADEILREAGVEALNVFIHADAVHRAVRVSELTGCTDATELQKMIAKKDGSRHTYYNHYTGKKWGDCHNYQMVLDSGALGYDLCVKLITEAAQAE